MRQIFLVLMLFFAIPVQADDKWTTQNTVLEIVYQTAAFVDWKQTRALESFGHSETNPLLGAHPSAGKVNAYFIGCAIGHLLIAYLLPEKWRLAFQAASVFIEIDVVRHNYGVGIRVSF